MSKENLAPKSAPSTSTRPIHITVFRGANAPKPKAQDDFKGWAELADEIDEMTGESAATKVGLLAIGPYRLAKPYRNDANVAEITLLMIDVDRCNADALVAVLVELGWAAMIYASPSDNAEGEPDARRVRVVCPVSRTIAPSECRHTRLAFAELLRLKPGCGAEKAVDASRLFFVGVLEGTPPRDVWRQDGEPADVDMLLARPLTHDWRAAENKKSDDSDSERVAPIVAATGCDWGRVERVMGLVEETYAGGDRHDMIRALAGYLARFGFGAWSDDEIQVLADCLPSDQRPTRVHEALKAAHQARDGEITIGYDYLRKRLGAELMREVEQAAQSEWWIRRLALLAARRAANDADRDTHGGDPGEAGNTPEVDEAIRKIAAPEYGVYQRGGALARITREATAEEGIIRPIGTPTIRKLGGARLDEIVSVATEYFDEKGKKKNDAWTCPYIEGRGEWRDIRPLDAIVTYPVMRPDGSILRESGYDASTRTIAELSISVDVSDAPSQVDALRALKLLFDLVGDFPFAGPAHRASWAAALLTVVARPAIDGPTPLTLFDASERGSGKTLLADVISIIATGESAPRRTAPQTQEEWRKVILTMLLSGDQVALIDNVTHMLASAALDAMLTGTTYRDRLLGGNEQASVPVRVVMLASANNCRLSSDLVRRTMMCRLEPQCERPEMRTGFRHADLPAHTRGARAEYLAAALTIVRAYAVAGRPKVDARPAGSYEAWCRVVRDALVWAGGADPVETQDTLREDADVERDELRELLVAWNKAYGERPVYLRDLVAAHHNSALRAALEGILPKDTPLTSHTIGNRLKTYRKRVVDGMQIVQTEPDRDGTKRWRVTRGL